MAHITDQYSLLRSECMGRAEWYKKPAVRRTIQVTTLVTVVALFVIASMSARALSSPFSRTGVLGNSLMSRGALIGCVTGGYVGSIALRSLRNTYLRKSKFYVADYIEQDRGFLYKVTHEGEEKGYLYGTIHVMPKNWNGLNPEVTNAIGKCEKVVVECLEISTEPKMVRALAKANLQPGVDFHVMPHAKTNGVVLEQFETEATQKNILSNLGTATMSDLMENFSCGKFYTYIKSAGNTRTQLDRTIVAWMRGDETEPDLLGGMNPETLSQQMREAHSALLDERNEEWMPKISEETSPCFIAVGCNHLFDIEGVSTGLITRMRNIGWTVERVEA